MFSVSENEKKQFIDLLSLQMGKHATSKGSSFCWREFSCCVREMTSNVGLFVQCFVIGDTLQNIVIIMMIIIVSIKVIKTFLFLLQNPFVLKIISHVIQTRKWDFYEADLRSKSNYRFELSLNYFCIEKNLRIMKSLKS